MQVQPDYAGFHDELEEREQRGFPIDRMTLREMAVRYHTPIPGTRRWRNYKHWVNKHKQPKESQTPATPVAVEFD